MLYKVQMIYVAFEYFTKKMTISLYSLEKSLLTDEFYHDQCFHRTSELLC